MAETSTSPEAYAAAVVKNVVASFPRPWFCKGTNSTVTWVLSTFAYKTAFVSNGFGTAWNEADIEL